MNQRPKLFSGGGNDTDGKRRGGKPAAKELTGRGRGDVSGRLGGGAVDCGRGRRADQHASGQGAGIPMAFLRVTAILLVFSVGYVAMARHVNNAGAFYAFAARGLGGSAGGAAAMIAILSYNLMQIRVMGLPGAATSGLFVGFGPPMSRSC